MASTTASTNVLTERYTSPEMDDIWSADRKVREERLLWILVMEVQAVYGVAIPPPVIECYRSVVDNIDHDRMKERERKNGHDVNARIEEFNALAGVDYIHKGMTSRDVTEVIEQSQVLQALLLVRDRLVAVAAGFARRAEQYKLLVMPGRSHNVAAQPITVGKRFAMYGAELLFHLDQIEEFIMKYPVRGVLGPMGTGADQLELIGEDGLQELQEAIAEKFGFYKNLLATGQVYWRSLDLAAISLLVNASCALTNFATTLRLMAGQETMGEGFREGQVGSSAMPHKRNCRSAERICGFGEVLRGNYTIMSGVAGHQWNEGDVACSVARRVALADAFFAMDGMIETTLTVLKDLGANPAMIAAEVKRYLPFLLTTKVLSSAINAGMVRSEAHDLIKRHSVGLWAELESGLDAGPDLFTRLGDDPEFPLDEATLRPLLDNPLEHVGLAVDQVDDVSRGVKRLVERYPAEAAYEPAAIL